MSVPDSESPSTTFAQVSALRDRADGWYQAELDPEWTIAGKPNGGYLLALLGRAAVATTSHSHVLAASAHYLRSPVPGPATIGTELLRAGRSASQVRARLDQGEQTCVEALVAVTDLDPAASVFWDRGMPAPGDTAFADCTRLQPGAPGVMRVNMLDQVDLRLEPASSGFMVGRPSGRGELRGWLALPHDEPFDPVSLLFAADSFPPATFDIEFTGWVPTLELTAYVRALPAPGPVRVLQRAQLIVGQRFDESCFIWDSTGRLVAHSTQLAGIRLG
ncbi:MAG TPA: thioesterase family protein [Acidimicrobiales bacterium]|jgi:hypothetical protein|nr:thioesterase family protein [Acidimicrobiales bacterium]